MRDLKELKLEIKHNLLNDKVVLMPTDTVFGLLVNANSSQAVESLYSIKNRPREKLFAILASRDNIYNYINKDPKLSNIELFMSGDVTLIFNDKRYQSQKIAIRIPNNEFLIELINECDFPIIATSANLSGDPDDISYDQISLSIKKHNDVQDCCFDEILNIISPNQRASSIFDVSSLPIIRELRPGKLSVKDLEKFIGIHE